jgi:glucuronoarabinoxylan endo-1,4-beta-xylanase
MTSCRNAKKAVARGAIVMATPWTPPPSMKTTTTSSVAGSASEFGNYANYLQGFANFMSSNGAGLFAISVQNETYIKVTYESCDWTSSDKLTIRKEQCRRGSRIRVIMCESFNFTSHTLNPILNDAQSRANVDIIGGHI